MSKFPISHRAQVVGPSRRSLSESAAAVVHLPGPITQRTPLVRG